MITKTTPKGWMLTLLSALFLLSGLTACSSTEDSAEDTAKPKPEVPINDGDWQTVPATGGTITKDSISITFPSGSFSKDTKVAITPISKGEIGGDYELSPFYQLTLPLKVDRPITIKIKSDKSEDEVRFLTVEPCFKKSLGELDKHSISFATDYSDGGYSLTFPATNNGEGDGELYVTFGLTNSFFMSGTRTRASEIQGKEGNLEWFYDVSWLTYKYGMNDADRQFMYELETRLNKYIPEAIKHIHALGFSIKSARQIPFNFTNKIDEKKPDAYGYFDQSIICDANSSIELVLPKLRTASQTEIKQTVIHELLHYFQSEYDPRMCITKAGSDESTMLSEAGAVWAEQFMDNGNMNGSFVKDYIPRFLLSATDIEAAYQSDKDKIRNSTFEKYSRHGYAMSTMLYYLTSPISGMTAFGIDKTKIIELYKKWANTSGRTFLPFKAWLSDHGSGFWDTTQFDDYVISLLSGQLIKHKDITAGNMGYGEGDIKSFNIKQFDKYETSDRTCYAHGISSTMYNIGYYTQTLTDKTFKDTKAVITLTGEENLHTYIIAEGQATEGENKVSVYKVIEGSAAGGDSLVIQGEALDALFGKGNLRTLHAITINHSEEKHNYRVCLELQGEKEESKPASVSPTSVSFEAEGGTDATVKITKGSYKYCNVDDIETPYSTWLSAKCSADGTVTIEAKPNTTTEERIGKVRCWVSNKENPSEADKKYLDPTITVTQKAGDGNSLLSTTSLEFPVEGGAKFIGYNFGTYLWMKRNWDDDTWLRTAWSKDYLNNISYNPSSDNRFANQLYVCCFPNETGKEREQAITFSYSMIKGFDFDTGDKFPVKIKQEGGSFNMEMMKNFFVGTWYTPQDITYSNGNYYHRRYTFRSDNTFTFEGQTTKSTSKPSSWKVEVNSTYSILNYEVKGECVKVYIKIPGNDGVWYKGLIERWPHFIFFAYENTDGSLTHGVYMEPE